MVEATLRGTSGARRWRGVIDAVRLSEREVTLIDYKGGSEQPSHREQLELYALLFVRDRVVNPSSRRASELVLAYDNGRTVSWHSPDDAALAALEHGLVEEVEQLTHALEVRPPEARPTSDSCGICAARPLCDAFWERIGTISSSHSKAEERASDYVDLEVQVGAVSDCGAELIGVAVLSSRQTASSTVRVLVPAAQRERARSVAAQDHVRILGAHVERQPSEDLDSHDVVLVLGPFSEMVRVSRC
jgi:hypothetical protein